MTRLLVLLLSTTAAPAIAADMSYRESALRSIDLDWMVAAVMWSLVGVLNLFDKSDARPSFILALLTLILGLMLSSPCAGGDNA